MSRSKTDAFLPNQWCLSPHTRLFPDSSGRSSHATSLTSSDLFNPVGHSPCCLISPIEHATFTFTANSSFNIQHLIAANSSFRVRLPSSRCDGSRSPSPPLPRNRCHTLPLRMVLSEQAQAADGPASRCPREGSRLFCGTRGSCRFTGFRPLALDEARGEQWAERERDHGQRSG
jgi:hypothetical protein